MNLHWTKKKNSGKKYTYLISELSTQMKLLNKKHTEKQEPLHYSLPWNDFLMSFVVYIALYKGKFDVNSCFLVSFVSNWTCTSLWPHCWSANAYWKFVCLTVEAAIRSKLHRFYMILGKFLALCQSLIHKQKNSF